MTRRNSTWTLLAIIVGAAWLRLYRLGAMPYLWDEDLTALAVQGIRDHGLPLLPSGTLYARALPYHYLATLMTLITDVGEFGLRLAGVVCSLGSIWLVYRLGRELDGRPAGLIAALLTAGSLWELASARNARMYPLLALLALGFLLAWVLGFLRDSRPARGTALALLGVAVLVQPIGASLAVVYLYPFVGRAARGTDARGWSAMRSLASVAAAGAVAAVMLAAPNLLARSFGAHYTTVAQEAATANLGSGPIPTRVRLPLPALWDYAGGWWLMGGILALGLSAAIVWTVRSRRRAEDRSWLRGLLALLLAAAVAIHQAVAVAAVLWLSAYLDRESPPRVRLRRLAVRGGLAASGLIVWAGFALWSGGPSAETARGTVLAMLDVPQRLWQFLPELFPVLFLAAVIVPAVRMLGPRCPPAVDLLGFVILASLVGLGMGTAPTRALRYISHLSPILLLLVAVQVRQAWSAARSPAGFAARLGTPLLRGTLIATVVLVALDVAPPWRIVDRLGQGLRSPAVDPVGGMWEGFGFYPDERSTAHYVADNRRPGDRVVAMNWLSYAAYAGPADFWLRTSHYENQSYRDGDDLRDTYTGAVLLPDLAALRRAAQAPGKRTWVVTSALELERGVRITPDIVDWLAQHDGQVVHTAGDGVGRVYLFDGM